MVTAHHRRGTLSCLEIPATGRPWPENGPNIHRLIIIIIIIIIIKIIIVKGGGERIRRRRTRRRRTRRKDLEEGLEEELE
jgi:hypothetical protein